MRTLKWICSFFISTLQVLKTKPEQISYHTNRYVTTLILTSDKRNQNKFLVAASTKFRPKTLKKKNFNITQQWVIYQIH